MVSAGMQPRRDFRREDGKISKRILEDGVPRLEALQGGTTFLVEAGIGLQGSIDLRLAQAIDCEGSKLQFLEQTRLDLQEIDEIVVIVQQIESSPEDILIERCVQLS